MLYNHIIGGKSVAIPTRPQLVPEVERDGSHFAGIECGLVVEADLQLLAGLLLLGLRASDSEGENGHQRPLHNPHRSSTAASRS